MKKSFLVFGIIIISVLALTACAETNTEPTAAIEPASPTAAIAEGRLLPVKWLDQSFILAGKVADVNVNDGDVVNEGDPLASLQPSADAALALARAEEEVLSAQQALDALKAEADLRLAQAELSVINALEVFESAQAAFDANTSDENKSERDAASAALTLAQDALTRIQQGDGIDPFELSAAEARLASAEAGMASAEAWAAAEDLTASLGGTVMDLSLQPGQMVAAGAPVMVVADISSWIVKTDNLGETQVASIAVGDRVEVALDALPDLKLTGEVTNINARYEEKRGDTTYTVTIKVAEIDPRMRWGMTAAIYFEP